MSNINLGGLQNQYELSKSNLSKAENKVTSLNRQLDAANVTLRKKREALEFCRDSLNSATRTVTG